MGAKIWKGNGGTPELFVQSTKLDSKSNLETK